MSNQPNAPKTPGKLLQLAATMPHAICRDVVYNAQGKVERRGELHYMTCVRCALERLAKELGE